MPNDVVKLRELRRANAACEMDGELDAVVAMYREQDHIKAAGHARRGAHHARAADRA